MKIAFIYDVIYPYVKGGVERRYYELAKRISKKHEIHIIGMKFWDGRKTIISNGIHYHGICKPVPIYGKGGKRSIVELIYFAWHLLLFLPGWIKRYDILDCASFMYPCIIICKLFCLFYKKKLVITWHEVWGKEVWMDYLGLLGLIGMLMEKLISWITPHHIAVSDYTADRLRDILGCKKYKVIPNGIDTEKCSIYRSDIKKYDIIYAGRLKQHKRVDSLIKAMIEVKKKMSNVKLHIFGSGPEEKRLKELVRILDLNENIFFHGFIEDEDKLLQEMGLAKIFVLPSEREGFGMAALESMAVGVPVIAINSPENALSRIIKNEYNGIMLEENERENLSDAIIDLLTNENKRKYISENAKDTTKIYDWKIISKKLMNTILL